MDNIEHLLPSNQYIVLENNLDLSSVLKQISLMLGNKIIFPNIEFDATKDILCFECCNEHYKIFTSVYLTNDFYNTLNKIIKIHIPYYEKFLINVEQKNKNILALISYDNAISFSLIKDPDIQRTYLEYKNFEISDKPENCYVGLFEYSRKLNEYYIFFLEITMIDKGYFKGKIYEGQDFDEKLEPIFVEGNISDQIISFKKIYADIFSIKFADALNKDQSLFYFPEEARTVNYEGTSYNNIYYGNWNKKEARIIFNGFLKKETNDSGFWKMRKI